MMTRKLSALALCALAMPYAMSADAGARLECAGPALDDVDDAIDDLIDQYMTAYGEFRRAYSAAETDAERKAAMAELRPDPEPYAAQVLALVKEHPGTDAAWQGLTWVIGRAGRTEAAKEALVVITSEYIEDERLGDICLRAARAPANESLVTSLEGVVKKSPHRDVRGKAAFALGMQYKQLENREAFVRQMGVVIQEYADVPYFRGDLKTKATGELFEIERLQIGMLAPDIEGADLDGVAFKLSDYRGKVVVLDFWGHW